MPFTTKTWLYMLGDDDVLLTPDTFPGATRVVYVQDLADLVAFSRSYAYVEYDTPCTDQNAIWNVQRFIDVTVEPCFLTPERAVEWVQYTSPVLAQDYRKENGKWVPVLDTRPQDRCVLQVV